MPSMDCILVFTPPRSGSRSGFSNACPLGLQARQNLFPRDRMLPDAHTSGIVQGVRYRARHGSDTRLTEALDPVIPTRFQAVHEYVRLVFGDIHDRGQPVGQVTNAVVPRAVK